MMPGWLQTGPFASILRPQPGGSGYAIEAVGQFGQACGAACRFGGIQEILP
jgi:hypothetical protein